MLALKSSQPPLTFMKRLQYAASKTSRWLVILSFACIATTALFVMMAWMVHSDVEVQAAQSKSMYQMVMAKNEVAPAPSQRQLPQPPTAMEPESIPVTAPKPEVKASAPDKEAQIKLSKAQPKKQATKPKTNPKTAVKPKTKTAKASEQSSHTTENKIVEAAQPASQGITRDAEPVSNPQPTYPSRMRQRNVEGYVVVSFTINEQGRTEDIKVLNYHPNRAFVPPVEKTVRRWVFKPKMINGKAVKQQKKITIEFKLT